MSNPKIHTKNVDLFVDGGLFQRGEVRLQQLNDDTRVNSLYVPRNVSMRDIDKTFVDMVKTGNLSCVISGKKVPVEFLKSQKYAEDKSQWGIKDEDGNISLPYITIKKLTEKPGTRMGGRSNLNKNNLISYVDIPINDNGQEIYLRFKGVQPTNIDFPYQVNMFSKMRNDVNVFKENFFTAFNSYQNYANQNITKINVNGYFFDVRLDNTEEGDSVRRFGDEDFYKSTFTVTVKGFIQNTDNWEMVKTTRRPRFTTIVR